MGTKNNPGKYDCYDKAEPDEPMFVLLARDRAAPFLVEAWAAIKCGDFKQACDLMARAMNETEASGRKFSDRSDEKLSEARTCAGTMRVWRANRPTSEELTTALSLTWTTKKPQKEGWYWVLRVASGVNTINLLRFISPTGRPPLRPANYEYDDSLEDWQYFAGPIPMPGNITELT